MKHFLTISLFILTLVIGGCTTLVPPPAGSQVEPVALFPQEADTAWGQVLRSVVNSKGQINFKKASRDTHLYRYIAYISKVSPFSHPQMFASGEEELAYFLNSYNALAMYGVIQEGFPADFSTLAKRAKFFKFNEFLLGGMKISLYDYENKIIRPLGDPRIHFALNCMVVGCPRLPREPFQAENIDDQLDRAAQEFVNNPEKVQVLAKSHTVRLSEIFKFYEEDFINSDQAKSFIAYINRYRRDPIHGNFKVEFIHYDWTLNQSPGPH